MRSTRVRSGRFEVITVPRPTPTDGQVLVRVLDCGVCASDLERWRHADDAPWFPGHEVAGVIAVGTSDLPVGTPVAVWATDHGLTEYIVRAPHHCIPAPDVPPAEAALGEPVGCMVNAVQCAELAVGDCVVIVGAGFMGNVLQRLCRLRGAATIVVADTRADALEHARRGGADHVVHGQSGGGEALIDVVHRMSAGRGADVSFEATGTQSALELLSPITRVGGTLVLAGFHQGGDRSIPLGEWNWKGLRLANAHFRDEATILWGIDRAVRLMRSGRLDVHDLISHRLALDDAQAGFDLLATKPPGFAKSVVHVQ